RGEIALQPCLHGNEARAQPADKNIVDIQDTLSLDASQRGPYPLGLEVRIDYTLQAGAPDELTYIKPGDGKSSPKTRYLRCKIRYGAPIDFPTRSEKIDARVKVLLRTVNADGAPQILLRSPFGHVPLNIPCAD